MYRQGGDVVLTKAVPVEQSQAVRRAVDRLDRLANEADQLRERVHNCMAIALSPEGPSCDQPGDCRKASPESDLANLLNGVADRLEASFRSIHRLMERSEL